MINRKRLKAGLRLFVFLLAMLFASGARGNAGAERSGSVHTRKGMLTIPTYLWGPDDVNPHFPLTHGRPIYPYPMQDNLSRQKVDKSYDTLVLENEFLRVTVIPALGGHVHSVFDKTAGREMFYVNQVVKPGLIGLRGAWISGGIEFNTGPQGHTVTCVSPLTCEFVDHGDGSKAIAVGNTERVFGAQWVAVVTLRPGCKFLEERIRIYNPTSYVQPYYFWNCTAVPNTDGTQFIYPMTLGSDHAGTSFFRWPIDKGVDLSWSKNYRGPTSIFAYECDQDFFGSYDHSVDHGIVAYANHFDLPGKKAWTWGRGPEGIAAQATLTDDGTLYNEVQTGPLVTQADYGLLQPRQTVQWTEWWYPVHGIGGYEFATRDVAVNVVRKPGQPGVTIKLIGTRAFPEAELRLVKEPKTQNEKVVASRNIAIRPESPTIIELTEAPVEPFDIELRAENRALASFTHPLPLPKREPPDLDARKNPMQTARDHWAAGVLADKEAKPQQAREHFEKALALDPTLAPAQLALAILDLESGLAKDARPHLETILERDPDDGLAHYYLSRALLLLGDESAALEHAWRAARDPRSDAIGLGVAGELYIRRRQWPEAIAAFERAVAANGQDLRNRNLLTIALAESGRIDDACAQARQALREDPLDAHAALTLPFLQAGDTSAITERLRREPQTVLDMAALVYRLNLNKAGLALLRHTSLAPNATATPISYYYAAVFSDRIGDPDAPRQLLDRAAALSPDYVFPDRLETIEVLEQAARLKPDDWHIPYYLGTIFLARDRKADALAAWEKALALGGDTSVLHRNLGLAKWKLDNDRPAAIAHYEKATARRADDQTLYRDLATLYQQTDQWAKARDVLEKTLASDRYRGDVIELLARTYRHLGEDAKAAALLDARTFHAWEGQRSLYEIYRDVHLELGRKALEAGDAPKAVAEFRRALAYPANIGVGRPERAREARELFFLGKALAAAGQADEARTVWKRAADEGSRSPGDYSDLAAQALKNLPR